MKLPPTPTLKFLAAGLSVTTVSASDNWNGGKCIRARPCFVSSWKGRIKLPRRKHCKWQSTFHLHQKTQRLRPLPSPAIILDDTTPFPSVFPRDFRRSLLVLFESVLSGSPPLELHIVEIVLFQESKATRIRKGVVYWTLLIDSASSGGPGYLRKYRVELGGGALLARQC